MTDKRCEVCGGEGADTLCRRCGAVVCRDCFDEETGCCLDCIEATVADRLKTRHRIQVTGLLLLLLGLSTMAAGLVTSVQAGGVAIIFPFIVGEVSPIIAGGYSFLFFSVLICASLLPWYIHTRRMEEYSAYQRGGEGITLQEGKMQGGESVVDYVITTEVPRTLEKTIIVETQPDGITLKSSVDRGFTKTYSIPDGYDLEGIDYDYDEGYLVLSLHLIRVG